MAETVVADGCLVEHSTDGGTAEWAGLLEHDLLSLVRSSGLIGQRVRITISPLADPVVEPEPCRHGGLLRWDAQNRFRICQACGEQFTPGTCVRCGRPAVSSEGFSCGRGTSCASL